MRRRQCEEAACEELVVRDPEPRGASTQDLEKLVHHHAQVVGADPSRIEKCGRRDETRAFDLRERRL